MSNGQPNGATAPTDKSSPDNPPTDDSPPDNPPPDPTSNNGANIFMEDVLEQREPSDNES
ncbi:hypothetical protein QBC46DRAFT_347986 [Diplogelasinospora grovesii]|uniref:Uncharacterized protein n=1 Tax=Diplogelasinospora grovesii TaxID=303347 RepID=A0AAN6MX31_9PEZI|nr:hypothetical protein QBC46DRAFT_347986 [Diplogelasinospora grovesii]